MAYYAYLKKDKEVHQKYHVGFVNGIKWGLKSRVLKKLRLRQEAKDSVFEIIRVDGGIASEVARVEKLLEFVNKELDAPPSNNAWKNQTQESIPGYAFVVLVKGLAVGLCVTEPISDVQHQGKWMVFRTQEIVPRQVNQLIRLGISRIWIAPKWRRLGLGNHLLEAVCKYLVHGLTLKPNEVAFSQPSSAGSLLAKNFNGVKHKSGEILLPVYIENA